MGLFPFSPSGYFHPHRSKILSILKERERLWNENDGSDYCEEKCWDIFLKIAIDDWDGFCKFLTEEASAMEFVYLSKIIIDLAIKLGNEKVVIPFRKVSEKYPEKAEEYTIALSSLMIIEEVFISSHLLFSKLAPYSVDILHLIIYNAERGRHVEYPL